MSGPLAIAATSAVLREVLRMGLDALDLGDFLGGDVTVSVKAPDRVEVEPPEAASQLNLFLYTVSRNAGWANHGLPARNGRGERIDTPVLGLDLHYLLTAYGAHEYDAEVLLAGALQVIHDTPGLSRELIDDVLTGGTVPPLLQQSELANQIESLKITPVPLTSEEISRLWTGLPAPYRPSVLCQVSVVLLESRRPVRRALPVLERALFAVPFRELRIQRVVPAAGPMAPITVGSTIRIVGRGLGSPALQVYLNGVDVTAGLVSRAPEAMELDLTGLPQLRAGVCGLQVVEPMMMGRPPVPHEGFTSNVATLVLSPEVTAVDVPGDIEVQFQPPAGPRQRVRLLLNQKNAPAGTVPRAYSLPAPAANGVLPPATETTTVTFSRSGVAAGTYLVRLQIDGADSRLTVGATGRFDQPEVTL